MYLRAISTLGCGSLGFDEALEFAHRYSLDGIELRILGGSLDLPVILAERFGEPAALARVAASLPMRVFALDTSFKLIGTTERERTDLLRFIPWAEALGVRHLRVFDGGRQPGDVTELAEAGATLAWWRALRAERGWRTDLMVETHDSLLTGALVARLVAVAGEVPVLWDAHHTWHKGGENPLQTWAAIGQHIVHVHVKDSKAGYYVLPGSGDFPMAPLQRVLAREYRGIVSLEWERWWHPTLPPLENALQAAAKRQWW